MVVPAFLFAFSLAGIGASLVFPSLHVLLLFASTSAVGSLILLLAALLRSWVRGLRRSRHWIFVDGSNVMHWKGAGAEIETVREVVDRLTDLGYMPGVVFDANAGYKLRGRYLSGAAMAKLLGLSASRVFVVPKGTPADPMLLAAARDANAQIVTNDRFRDWAEIHPEVAEAGYLVRGEYRAGRLWLEVGAASH